MAYETQGPTGSNLGRPAKFNPTIAAEILKLAGKDFNVQRVARAVGIAPGTLHAWLWRGRHQEKGALSEFAKQFDKRTAKVAHQVVARAVDMANGILPVWETVKAPHCPNCNSKRESWQGNCQNCGSSLQAVARDTGIIDEPRRQIYVNLDPKNTIAAARVILPAIAAEFRHDAPPPRVEVNVGVDLARQMIETGEIDARQVLDTYRRAIEILGPETLDPNLALPEPGNNGKVKP